MFLQLLCYFLAVYRLNQNYSFFYFQFAKCQMDLLSTVNAGSVEMSALIEDVEVATYSFLKLAIGNQIAAFTALRDSLEAAYNVALVEVLFKITG